MIYASHDDQQLAALLRHRDERALAALYDRHSRLAFALALRLLRDRERAEEIVQDVFVKLWRQPDAYTPERGQFQAWFLSVVHHRAVDALRAWAGERRHVADTADSDLTEALPDRAPALDEQIVRQSERDVVGRALSELPAAQREAIALAYFEGLTQSEIAARLGEPLGTVKTRIRTGMLRLRAALAPAGAGVGDL
ncbi:MAG: sigma-70 family RNA polymerase sigma factor [Chloroflexi bacterium]|nr:sigma-70 family RNA polymerase sigma factor [Chloroflexota bacterium]